MRSPHHPSLFHLIEAIFNNLGIEIQKGRFRSRNNKRYTYEQAHMATVPASKS